MLLLCVTLCRLWSSRLGENCSERRINEFCETSYRNKDKDPEGLDRDKDRPRCGM